MGIDLFMKVIETLYPFFYLLFYSDGRRQSLGYNENSQQFYILTNL